MSEKLISVSVILNEVRSIVLQARNAASRNINAIQVLANFSIGRIIVEHEQKGKHRANYGEKLLEDLSRKLTKEFGRGFSRSNLEYMRRFFLDYKDRVPEISQKASGKLGDFLMIPQMQSGKSVTGKGKPVKRNHGFSLSWSHYVFLMSIKDNSERCFYEIESSNEGWSLPELKRQFNASLYERLALSRDKKGIRKLSSKGQIVNKPEDVLKDPLVLEFLGLEKSPRYSECELESSIINHIEKFLLELGKGFLFEARQKRFTFDSDHYFVDLVFYNRLLRCFVLIDLKIGKLTHQDLGQMQMYVNYYDRQVKTEEENPTVGILLCRQKQKALVELTLPERSNIKASEYKLYLPSKAELKKRVMEVGER